MAEVDPKAAQNNNDAAAGGKDGAQGGDKGAGGQGDGKSTLLTGDGKDGKSADGKDGQAGDGKDGKAGDGKDGKPGDGKEGKDGKKAEGAPEKYEQFTAPEGVQLDQELVTEFTTLAKAKNLSQEAAQEVLNLGAKAVQKALSAQTERWGEIREGWVNDLKADKEFGGEKFNETVEGAKRALKRFGSDSFTGFLNATGYGDNADFIRLLARVDKATREDTVVDGDEKGEGAKDAASVLYPNQGKK